TNAFMFSHILLQRRAGDMSLLKTPIELGKPKNFDLDAPAWWNVGKKRLLYYEGGIEGGFERAIMQFAMSSADGPTFRSWEADFMQVLAYIRSRKAPVYPWPIDRSLASSGERVFNGACSGCHGTYGTHETFPNKVVPLSTVGTDPLRLTGMTPE